MQGAAGVPVHGRPALSAWYVPFIICTTSFCLSSSPESSAVSWLLKHYTPCVYRMHCEFKCCLRRAGHETVLLPILVRRQDASSTSFPQHRQSSGVLRCRQYHMWRAEQPGSWFGHAAAAEHGSIVTLSISVRICNIRKVLGRYTKAAENAQNTQVTPAKKKFGVTLAEFKRLTAQSTVTLQNHCTSLMHAWSLPVLSA